MPRANNPKLATLVGVSIFLAAKLLTFLLTADIFHPSLDEGTCLEGGHRMLRCKAPYRDLNSFLVPNHPKVRFNGGMQPRINFYKISPGAMQAMRGLEEYIHSTSLEKPLIELVKMRASQINGCGYCLDMHSKDARAAGETEQRLYCLPAWHESPFYSERERAALEWTEALTLIADNHVPDDVFERVQAALGEKDLVDLSLVVTSINSWNRFAIGFRAVPGSYQVPARAGTAQRS